MSEFNDDLLLTPALRQRLDLEAVPDHMGEVSQYPWFAWVQRTNGECHKFANQPIFPAEQQQLFALDLTRLLNDELRHDGAWVTGWVQPQMFVEDLGMYAQGLRLQRTFGKCICIWLDEDGDAQFTIEIVEPMWRIERALMDAWIEQAEDGWQKWHRLMRQELKPNQDQLFKRAQGQTTPSQKQRNYEPLIVDF